MPRSLPRVVAILAATLCAGVLAACAPTSPSPSPTAGSSSAPAPGVTATGGAVTTGPAPAPRYPSSAEDYAKAGVAAWVGHDIARLDDLEESGGTLHMLYGCNGCYNMHFTLVRCEGAAGSSYCRFFNNVGDDLLLRLNNASLGQARAITAGSTWDPISFPSDDQAYAQKALDAWQAGNDARLKLLTGDQLTSAQVSALGADKAQQWTFTGSNGAAGTIGFVFKDTNGHTLTFLFTNGPAAPTTGPGSQHRIKQILYDA